MSNNDDLSPTPDAPWGWAISRKGTRYKRSRPLTEEDKMRTREAKEESARSSMEALPRAILVQLLMCFHGDKQAMLAAVEAFCGAEKGERAEKPKRAAGGLNPRRTPEE
jgi:hypothetical protein